MKNSNLILTEQRQPDEEKSRATLQEIVTAWLTRELTAPRQ